MAFRRPIFSRSRYATPPASAPVPPQVIPETTLNPHEIDGDNYPEDQLEVEATETVPDALAQMQIAPGESRGDRIDGAFDLLRGKQIGRAVTFEIPALPGAGIRREELLIQVGGEDYQSQLHTFDLSCSEAPIFDPANAFIYIDRYEFQVLYGSGGIQRQLIVPGWPGQRISVLASWVRIVARVSRLGVAGPLPAVSVIMEAHAGLLQTSQPARRTFVTPTGTIVPGASFTIIDNNPLSTGPWGPEVELPYLRFINVYKFAVTDAISIILDPSLATIPIPTNVQVLDPIQIPDYCSRVLIRNDNAVGNLGVVTVLASYT